MKNLLLILTFGFLLFSCDKSDDIIEINEQDYLVFGHFYGMCAGDGAGCVQTYMLTDQKLYEDVKNDYTGQDLQFIEMSNDSFAQVKNLGDYFPTELLNESDGAFGCPDCADGGGLYIKLSQNGNVRSWRIDQMKDNVPEYLHTFMDKVNEKIALIEK
ncbi:hypothetical protein [Flammeovirga sp. SJP92]|uniref:hypothetical protein n=1 Tax=Flammeovirga sp. SJP92 TaxID=1775430 RepID=UPI000786DEFD|nr:hypothetical protein [Flammeovirga sp. SJP92]KXX71129.1 hypothetical protein AVL50_09870 [Flammeovirga sp. SJP92]